MYPFSRLSSKYSLRTFCSFGESGYTLLLITFGAFRVNSILWSQGRWGGNWRASCSENTFQCRLKAAGTDSSVLTLVSSYAFSAICCAIVVFLIFIGSGSKTSIVMMSSSPSSNWAMATVCTCCRNSFCVSLPLINVSALKRDPSTRPSGQLISGLKVANQGYPKMNRSPPRFVTKNLVLSCFLSRNTNRSQQWVMLPERFKVPSMFLTVQMLSSFWVPNRSLVTIL